jgi:hypothetical protein
MQHRQFRIVFQRECESQHLRTTRRVPTLQLGRLLKSLYAVSVEYGLIMDCGIAFGRDGGERRLYYTQGLLQQTLDI